MRITKKRGYILLESENDETISGFDCINCTTVKIVKLKNGYACQVTVWNNDGRSYWYTENWDYARRVALHQC